jgi:hypothetical protein
VTDETNIIQGDGLSALWQSADSTANELSMGAGHLSRTAQCLAPPQPKSHAHLQAAPCAEYRSSNCPASGNATRGRRWGCIELRPHCTRARIRTLGILSLADRGAQVQSAVTQRRYRREDRLRGHAGVIHAGLACMLDSSVKASRGGVCHDARRDEGRSVRLYFHHRR